MSNIVLIEDNNQVRENIKEILELDGYNVFDAENGKKGIEAIRINNPDLIICDIMMPELDGYGVLKILNKKPETAKIPFIFLTAKNEMKDQRKGMNLGADDYLAKPFTDLELIEAVETRLKRVHFFIDIHKTEQEQATLKIDTELALKYIQEHWQSDVLPTGTTLCKEGSITEKIFMIESGIVKKQTLHATGKQFIYNYFGKHQFIGYTEAITLQPYQATLTCETEVEFYSISQREFIELLQTNTMFFKSILKLMAKEIHQHEQKMVTLAYSTVKKRLIEALLKLENVYTHTNGFMIIPRQELASFSATTKETAIRTLKDLEEDGYIETSHYGVKITNKNGLEELLKGNI